ncbi:hypothetical protein BDN70DRAFT_27139 [Pholiota conissans]|uniref:NACHT domain-containing protein n=1 Tax=Pholiota conissans TaxID=109636 RepID=A0A9P5ZEE9_9AGAR|nr:hypothetical protein BDN70DRAFT_27139 [Pholiota conissans]
MHIIRNTKQIYRHVDNVNVSGGHFVTAKSVYYQTPAPPLETLYKHCAPGALLDSAERFDPPKCDENTRVAIIKTIMDWITGGGDSSSILWLHGPAGAGKSALAQTIAELCKEQDLLAAVFFFARNSPDRANGRLLIATLVHQLTSTFPRTRSYIQKSIHRDESVFDRNISSQAEDLLVLPIKKFRGSLRQLLRRIFLQSKHPRLIVIDGLDECNDADVQTEILKAIAESSRKLRFPFRFLIASRPESHIRSAFDHHPSLDAAYVTRFDLVDVLDIEKDIKTYLTSEFKKIRNEHQLRNHIPASWPQDSEIDTLVERASGQFIYASTIMKYIQSSKHRPTDRLRVILGLYAKPASDTPYASLDALYTHIFHSVDDIFRVMQIFGALVIPRTVDDGLGTFNTPEMLDKLLCFQPGDTELILSDLLSIVRLDDHTSPIRLHHASLGDFLLDPSRSGPVGLFVEKRQVHERLARGYLHLLQGVVVPSYHSANDKEFDSYLTSFRMNYDRAIFSANLLNDLLHAKFIAIFRYFCARTTPEIPESISITMKSTDAETMQSFWKMRNLWRSRGMDQLFHPFTRQEIGSVSCEKILDAYLQDLDDHCRLDDNLHEALDTLLSQPRFQDYVRILARKIKHDEDDLFFSADYRSSVSATTQTVLFASDVKASLHWRLLYPIGCCIPTCSISPHFMQTDLSVMKRISLGRNAHGEPTSA